MSEFEVFLFGCANFAILIIGLIWGLRRGARQFFYARREGIKRQMVSSAKVLREAKVRASASRRLSIRLEEDIAHRRQLIEASCRKECEQIGVEAKRRAAWIIDGAGRQAQEERRRTLAEVRRRMLALAFVRAEALLRGKVGAEAEQKILSRGLEDLPSLVAKTQGASVAAAGAR